MHSKIAEESRRALQQAVAGLTPEQRLNTFLNLCRTTAALKAAGDEMRRQERPRPSKCKLGLKTE
jgi:hypothetical protein